jgi:hypothetical protein
VEIGYECDVELPAKFEQTFQDIIADIQQFYFRSKEDGQNVPEAESDADQELAAMKTVKTVIIEKEVAPTAKPTVSDPLTSDSLVATTVRLQCEFCSNIVLFTGSHLFPLGSRTTCRFFHEISVTCHSGATDTNCAHLPSRTTYEST